MATNYIGDSIGDAARSEERARERWLNLQLANRDFLARQQARRDSIAAQNAANAMSAHDRGLAMNRADRADALNMRLGLEEQAYNRNQDFIDTILGLDEAEKNRKLQRELNTQRNDNYLQRLQQSEDQRTYADIAKRIATDEIRDIPSLQDAEGGRLGSDEWVDLKTRLGQHQARMQEEEDLGPGMAAREATNMLRFQPNFEADPVTAMNTLANNLARNRMFAGKIVPDYERKEFRPVANYKYSGPSDAIDWYRPGGPARVPPPTTSPTPAPAAPARDIDLLDRFGVASILGLTAVPDAIRGIGRAFQRPAPAPASLPAPAPAAVDQPMRVTPVFGQPIIESSPVDKLKIAEVRALINSGMPATQAVAVVKAKYADRATYDTRTF